MISGNVAAYSRCLNDAKRRAKVTSAVAKVSADKRNEKKKKKAKMMEEQKSKKVKKQKQRAETSKQVWSALASTDGTVRDGTHHRDHGNILRFSDPEMRVILKYYYSSPAGLLKMSKDAMAKCITEQLMARVAVSTESTAEVNAAAPDILSTNAYHTNNE